MKYTSRIKDKKYALIAAIQSGAAYDYATAKARRQFKRPASEKKPYQRGKLGPSAVAKAINDDYGRIVSRRGRKQHARVFDVKFQKYYSQG
ncbi:MULTISPECIES: hypothetical protein [unclassified Paenibacillus]|uniref:hypothetical protein n=1 Tax=unclassified Paenibacillus TaxID=185978 RepID=UPI0030F4BAF2